jgi:hypothetical protein
MTEWDWCAQQDKVTFCYEAKGVMESENGIKKHILYKFGKNMGVFIFFASYFNQNLRKRADFMDRH